MKCTSRCLLVDVARAKCKLKVYCFLNGFPLSYFLHISIKLHRSVVSLTEVGKIQFAPVKILQAWCISTQQLSMYSLRVWGRNCMCECKPRTVIFHKYKSVYAWRGSGWAFDYSGCYLKKLLSYANQVRYSHYTYISLFFNLSNFWK